MDLTRIEPYRSHLHEMRVYGTWGDETNGVFLVPSPIDGRPLQVIASDGCGWDHVSVSARKRCPNWKEMEFIKRLCFREDEDAMQLHVPPAEHINFHATCLHLWRPQAERIPRPPAAPVAPLEVVTG